MENAIVQQLDINLECNDCMIQNKKIILKIASKQKAVTCPFCGKQSSKVHSAYQREIQDLPIHEKQTILLLNTRKMFCINPQCQYKTFSERFDFVQPGGKKTKRLTENILITSAKLSSVSASKLLASNSIHVSKSSICDLLKKNASPCG